MEVSYSDMEKLRMVSSNPDLFLVVVSKKDLEDLERKREKWLETFKEKDSLLAKDPKAYTLVFELLLQFSRLVGRLEGSL